MAYRSVKRLYRLPAQNSSGSVRNSHAYANRRALAPLLAQAEIRIQRSLDIERVERRLNEKYVNPRRIQRLHLRSVRRNKLVEIDGARRGILHIGRYARRLVHRPYRARNKKLLSTKPRGRLRRLRFRNLDGARVHAAHQILPVAVFGLHQKIRPESSGRHYVGAGIIIGAIDFRDYVWAGEI